MSRISARLRVPRLRAPGNAYLIAFCSGVILLYRLALWPASVWWLAVAMLAAAIWWWSRLPSRRHLAPALLCCFLVGLLWAGWSSFHRLDQKLGESEQGRTVGVSGYLCSLPSPGSFDSLRFDFCVTGWLDEQSAAPSIPRPQKLRLAWYGREGRELPDHRLRLDVVLKRPHGNLNSAGFRYEDWLFRNGIRATGSIRDIAAAPGITCGWVCHYHQRYRQVAQVVHERFREAEYYPLIASLLIGNRNYLTDEHWQTLKATGTIHLVAISGLHLGLLALAVGVSVRKLLLLLPVVWLPEHRIRLWTFCLVVGACFLYALLAGFGVPTRRALIMVGIGGWYLLLARETSPWRPYLLALTLVLALDPFAPLDQGFWLSFGAVTVLLLAFAGRFSAPGWLKGLVIAQLAIFAGLWPILTELGQQQPLAGMVANLVAIPWLSLVVMPLLFAGVLLGVLLGAPVLNGVMSVFDLVLGVLWSWLQLVQSLSLPSLADPPGLLVGLLAVCVLLALRFPMAWFRTLTMLVVLVWGGLVIWDTPARANLPVPVPEVVIWDVGQGLSVLVRSESRVLIYDTGPGVEGVYSSVESVLIPGLEARGVRRIDDLVVSHGDNDHAGGLSLLLQSLEIGRWFSGEAQAIAENLDSVVAARIQPCPDGVRYWAGLALNFWHSSVADEGNAASCVLEVYHPGSGTSLWLTGDITKAVEREMLEAGVHRRLAERRAQQWVVAPHHGSRTSSSPDWIRAMAPDEVIYTAGYQHRYGHPHPEVTRRYRDAGAQALNTACSGEISITFNGEGPVIHERRHFSPFWIGGAGLARDQCQIP
ncbi:DNA internalization-related competence protein ComEC/Rec2 [Marinobacter persicus]|uniref:Competence protein ComEC n=1 Tax=Marinobacter persicus TaxID=930118 RepID=A0A2S6G8U6_9GAMM|nr:DNA internalization-related competence protein ComEC/Rec2 [Marinobacter persicus]PPK52800.1 competence protein ComEC [Marinobacter persicus]PPK55654.1 competence protein ComEC [Marinobacter persicus]PPK59311.1 competence protein ComEC [Marinobacter persicus]